MVIRNIYAGIMTANINKAVEWYERLLNRKPDYHPMETLYEWDFSEGGVLQLIEDKKRAGFSSVTVLVDDIEASHKQITHLNIKIDHQSNSDIAKTITIQDQENNRITFAENMEGR